MDARGVSPVIGLVLLLGIAAIGSLTFLVVGATVMDGTQSATEQEQIESSMSEFSQTAQAVSSGDVGSADFSFDVSDQDSLVVDEEAGHVNVTLEHDGGEQEIIDASLGKFVYERDDGSEVAYQGGGVWGYDGDGEPRMVEPPEFEYRIGEENEGATLTFPLTRVVDDGTGTVSGDGSLSVSEENDLYPTANDVNPLEGGEVFVNIESEYCEAWEEHLEDRTDSSVQERCSGNGTYTDEGELRFKLVVPSSGIGEIEEGVRVPGEFTVDGGGGQGLSIYGDVTTSDKQDVEEEKTDIHGDINEDSGVDLPGVRDEIDDYIDQCENDDRLEWDDDPDEVISDPGIHCIEGDHTFTKNDPLSIDADQGAVTVVFKDSFKSNGAFHVDGQDDVNIFVNNEAEIHDIFGNPSDPQQTNLIVGGTGDRALDAQAQSELFGFLYAPHGGADIRSQSGLTGAVFAEDVTLGGSKTFIDFVEFDEPPTFGSDDSANEPTLYYLHVSETVVSVDDE